MRLLRSVFGVLLVLFVLSPSFVNAVGADSSTIMRWVLKIAAYRYDLGTNEYRLNDSGTAVAVGNNRILTNAHVVLDELSDPLDGFEVCEIRDVSIAPKCTSAAVLIGYDSEADLALLEVVKPWSGLNKSVTFATKLPGVGDTVSVIGFPANGGSTVSTTYGKISGFSEDMIKVDANLDSGNSGGGAFNGNGEFIGVPTEVRSGETTMGYVKNLETVRKFLAGKSTDYTKVTKKSVPAEFLSSLQFLQKTPKDANVIRDEYFNVPNIKKYGFKLGYRENYAKLWLRAYYLTPTAKEDYDTVIKLQKSTSYGKILQGSAEKDAALLRDLDPKMSLPSAISSGKYKVYEQTAGWKYRYWIDTDMGITVEISSKNSDNPVVKKARSLVETGLKITLPKLQTENNKYKNGIVQITIPENLTIGQSLSWYSNNPNTTIYGTETNQNYYVYGAVENFTTKFNPDATDADMNADKFTESILESFQEKFEDQSKSKLETAQYRWIKNKDGYPLLNIRITTTKKEVIDIYAAYSVIDKKTFWSTVFTLYRREAGSHDTGMQTATQMILQSNISGKFVYDKLPVFSEEFTQYKKKD